MKTTKGFVLSALSGIALVLLGGNAQGGYQAVGNDGIAASPKLRQQLDERTTAMTMAMNTTYDSQTVEALCADQVAASPKLKQFFADQATVTVAYSGESYPVGYYPTGPDGITASPKLRQMLDERNAAFEGASMR